jgi:hypothetical protein
MRLLMLGMCLRQRPAVPNPDRGSRAGWPLAQPPSPSAAAATTGHWASPSLLGVRLPWAPGHRGRQAGTPGRLRGRHLAAIVVGIATASFVVRLWFPLGSAQVANLKPWQWPQFLAMFGLGITSARRGWLAPVPDRLRRGCGLAALAAMLSFPLVVLVATAVGLPADLELFLGGWRWQAAAAAVAEGCRPWASVWLLGLTRRHAGPRGRLGHALARSAYGAFLVQGPVLIALALALRPRRCRPRSKRCRRRRRSRRLVRAGVAARHPDPPPPDPVS